MKVADVDCVGRSEEYQKAIDWIGHNIRYVYEDTNDISEHLYSLDTDTWEYKYDKPLLIPPMVLELIKYLDKKNYCYIRFQNI